MIVPGLYLLFVGPGGCGGIPLSPAALDFCFLLAAMIFFFLKASHCVGVGCPFFAKDAAASLLVICLVCTISEISVLPSVVVTVT